MGERISTVFSNKSHPIDILYVGESIIDCISHYQLKHENTPLNLVYVSTEGTLTEGQMRLLRIILDKNEVKSMRTIFDNDKQGYKYTLWMQRYFYGKDIDTENMSTAELAAEVAMLDSAELPEHKDWNDDLKIVYNNR